MKQAVQTTTYLQYLDQLVAGQSIAYFILQDSTATQLLSLNSDGGMTSAGVVTAASFAGAGTALTGLNASNLSSGTVALARMAQANTTTSGYLSNTDWNTFNNKLSGAPTITLTGGVTGSGTGSFAATVVTNANLTGPITSAGNATTVASQTGTGSKFVMDTAPTIVGGSHTALTALGLRSTGAAFDLTLATGEVFTAGRTLSIILGDVARTLTFTGNASISGTNTGDQTSVSGNAGTATTLATARNINGVSFNGGADITVTAAAGTLSGGTLASGVTASSLTSFGASPALTGTPTAPTASVATNTTQIATCAFVLANAGSASGANPTGITGLSAVNGSAGTFLRSDGAPALSQAIAPTWTGQHIFSLAGAASAPPVSLTGAWFITGGTATTTKPQFLVEASGATTTAWSTAGTGIGVNSGSTFTGRLLDLQKNGVSKFSVTSGGVVTGGTFNCGSVSCTGLTASNGVTLSGTGQVLVLGGNQISLNTSSTLSADGSGNTTLTGNFICGTFSCDTGGITSDGNGNLTTTSLLTGVVKNSAAQTTVNGSTSGTAKFSQPEQGSSYKVCIIYASVLVGTASYTFPTAFTNTPMVLGTLSGIAAVTTTSITLTGTTSTGNIIVIGY